MCGRYDAAPTTVSFELETGGLRGALSIETAWRFDWAKKPTFLEINKVAGNTAGSYGV